jgi:hypothetical protein
MRKRISSISFYHIPLCMSGFKKIIVFVNREMLQPLRATPAGFLLEPP